MSIGRKVLVWSGSSVVLLLLALVVLLVTAPFWINLNFVQSHIKAHLDRETGGRARYGEMALSLMPRPHVTVHEAAMSLPEGSGFSAQVVTLYPELSALLRGDLRLASVAVVSPRVDLKLPDFKSKESKTNVPAASEGPALILSEIREWIEKTGHLAVRVENGSFDTIFGGGQTVQFQGVNLKAENTKGFLEFQASCDSELFSHMEIDGKIDAKTLKGNLVLKEFNIKKALKIGSVNRYGVLEEGLLNLKVAFDGVGPQNVAATIQAFAPSMVLSRNHESVKVKDFSMNGQIQAGKDELNVSVSSLTLVNPRLNMAGSLKWDSNTPQVEVKIDGSSVDVGMLRVCAVDFGKDIPAVKNLFDVLVDGTVPFVSVAAKGRSFGDLAELEKYVIEGNIHEGNIRLPKLGFDLKQVNGSVLISNGILTGQRLQATLQKTKGREGMLTLSLTENLSPFVLDILLDTDLAQAHTILKDLIREGPLAEELQRIHSVEGKAQARLRLEQKEEGLQAAINSSSCHLQATYGSLGMPVYVKKGSIDYRGNQVHVRDLAGSYGRSSFFVAYGLLEWQNDLLLALDSVSGTVDLGQLFAPVAGIRGLPEWFYNTKNVRGSVLVQTGHLTGPLLKPSRWDYSADLELREVLFQMPELPDAVMISKGRVMVTPQVIKLFDGKARFLDANLSVSGTFEDYWADSVGFSSTLSGHLGSQAVQYLYERLDLPTEFQVRTPFQLATGNFNWHEGGVTVFDGNLNFSQGTRVDVKISAGNGNLEIEKIDVEDAISKASFSLLLQENLINADFSGKLEKSSLDAIFSQNRYLNGWIEGQMSLRVLPGQTPLASAEGSLKGHDVKIYGLDFPLTVDDVAISAEGTTVRVDSARLALEDNFLSVTGNADFSPEYVRFDLDLATEHVDLREVLKAISESKKPEKHFEDENFVRLPVRGTAHLMFDTLKIGDYTCQPFQGEFNVGPEGMRIVVENAHACGISTPGVVHLKPGGARVNLKVKAGKTNLNRSITCLTQERVSAEGTFDLDGKIEGDGSWDDLGKKLKGEFLFNSQNGSVEQDPALARMLGVLNITNIFKGQLPDLKTKALPYDSLSIRAGLEDARIQIHQGVMRGPSLNLAFKGDLDVLNDRLDLTFLASPFTLTDRIIRWLPVAGYILGGSFLSVAVKVEGPVKSPDVRILAPSEVGAGFVGMIKRTLETPVKIVEPLLGEETKSTDQDVEDSVFN